MRRFPNCRWLATICGTSGDLHTHPGEKVIRLRRLRVHDALALACSEDIFPAGLLGESRLEERELERTLSSVFAALGIELVSADAHIEAAFRPTPFADLAEVDKTRPWLLAGERCVDQRGVSVLYTMTTTTPRCSHSICFVDPGAAALAIRPVHQSALNLNTAEPPEAAPATSRCRPE
jgi:hypothetical protein